MPVHRCCFGIKTCVGTGGRGAGGCARLPPAFVYKTPATPLEMALKLERELARGAGMLMPDPERRVRLEGGAIPLDAAAPGFPPEFLAGLVPEEIHGVEAWRAVLCADDLTGDMLFYNAAGEPFWSVAADPAVWSADWIARLHSADGTAADFFDTEERYHELLARPSRRMRTPDRIIYRSAWLSTRQYFLPSHVEMAFTFLLREDLGVYRSGGTAGTRSAAGAPSRSPAALTGLAFTGISSDTNGVALSAAWPAGTALAGGVLDIFFTPTLVPPAWTNPWRVALDPDDAGVDLLIPRADLPPPPEAPAPACVTNMTPSAYDPNVIHTNVICTNAVRLADTGFFRLADAADTDGDGLLDSLEAAGYRVVEWGAPYAGSDAVPRPDGLFNVLGVSAKFFHVLAVRADGTVACWGKNSFGQCSPPPQATGIVSAAAGYEHSVALRADGTIVCWGCGYFGLLTPPASATNVTAVAAGAYHTAALRADGTVVCWGNGSSGQCAAPSGLTNAVAVAAGGLHTVALTADGAVVCWGDGTSGQTQVPQNLGIVSLIGAGGHHTLACMGTGEVAVWGLNGSGQS
ncbi:MAG TPA: hypothetical protein P5026_10855 [Kiritimatiellia bacterium]|nr:hypothetical protein [Kiritimatiellia bacterium]